MIKKIGALCALLMVVGCSKPAAFGIQVVGKYVTRAQAQCAMVKSADLAKITGKDTNCVCVAGPTTDEEFADVRTAYGILKFVVVRNTYLVQDKSCDPTLSDEETLH